MQNELNDLDVTDIQEQKIKSSFFQRLSNYIREGKYKRLPFKILVEDNWFTRNLYKIFPRQILAPLMYELSIVFSTLRLSDISKKYTNATDLLVNLGCGEQGRPGWINVDACAWPTVNCVWDCRKNLPFPNNSVKGIFCEHFFEHLHYKEEVPYFLAECYRVLKSGGVMRIIVPDAGKYLEAYCQEGWEELSQLRRLDSELTDFFNGEKYQTKMEVINEIFRQGFEHKYAYDYATLELILSQAGFSTVQRQEFAKSFMEEFSIDYEMRACESIYVEGVKGDPTELS